MLDLVVVRGVNSLEILRDAGSSSFCAQLWNLDVLDVAGAHKLIDNGSDISWWKQTVPFDIKLRQKFLFAQYS